MRFRCNFQSILTMRVIIYFEISALKINEKRNLSFTITKNFRRKGRHSANNIKTQCNLIQITNWC